MVEYETGSDNGCRPADCSAPSIRNYSNGRCRTVPVEQKNVYQFTAATIDGVRSAARTAVGELASTDSCITRSSPITVNQLSAWMLSIPVREVGGGSSTYNPSPMVLSRGDGWNRPFTINRVTKYLNRNLYSRGTYADEKRAHWNPGVGLWQLDRWTETINLNHAQRANVETGGLEVAQRLRAGICSNDVEDRLGIWVACNAATGETENRCRTTFNDIYDETGDSLFVRATAGSDADGGVQDRECRWGTTDNPTGNPFPCFLYDIASAEGNLADSDPEGLGSQTPLAAAFVSFTDPDDSTKYAVFPASLTGYSATLIRAVPRGVEARLSTLGDLPGTENDGKGWFAGSVNGKYLYWKTCTSPDPSAEPPVVTCTWSRL